MASMRKAFLNIAFFVWIISNVQTCPDVPKLRIVPGSGWDALTNKVTKQILQLTYDQCKLTDDGRLLIPDNTFVVPLNNTQEIDVKSQIFEHWSNYTEPTSAGFKVATDVWPEQFLPLYFSFSDHYQEMKSLQVTHGAFTCRSEMRQVVYRLNTSQNTAMDGTVKERFQKVIGALVRNKTEEAKYLIEMVVRDYGTHYTKSIDVGSVLVKEDYLREEFLYEDRERSKILSASKLSLLEYTDFSWRHKKDLDSSLLSKYNKAVLKRKFRYFGGLDWERGEVPVCLVAIDKTGDLLSNLVTPSNFPKASSSLLIRAKEMFSDVIRDYYARNIHRGCTMPKSSSFEFASNLDDGSCTPETTIKYFFGGVYATCSEVYLSTSSHACGTVILNNPLTKTTSCPTNFEASIVHSRIYVSGSQQSSGHNAKHNAMAIYKYQTFVSCMANESIGISYLFGGLYSSDVDNIHTMGKSCPPSYTAVSAHAQLGSLSICVNNTNDDSAKLYALPFGGFASAKNEYQCPLGYKKHLAMKFKATVPESVYTSYEKFKYSIHSDENIYYCLQEYKKNVEQIASLIAFESRPDSDCPWK